MISVPLIDELRETRRRLANECAGDLDRYAEMLRQVSGSLRPSVAQETER